ncbi:hypothetical protein SDIAM26S_05716 [Streptomyces diastaticus subsp. diastaticus]
MPAQAGETYPDAGHVVQYLTDYEKRYNLPVQHGARVGAVHRDGERLLLEADSGTWRARARSSAPPAPGRGPSSPLSTAAASSQDASSTR